MLNKKEINTIHDDDLLVFLKKAGLLYDYKNKKLKCHFCGDFLDDNNFYAIIPLNNNINFCCNKKGCIDNINI